MTIDLFTYQPRGVDYPNFRYFMSKYGYLFNKKFLYVSEHYTQDITPNIDEFLIEEYQKLGFEHVSPLTKRQNEDWCDFAIKSMLEKSNAEAFLIMHPDFLIKDMEGLMGKILKELEEVDLVSFDDRDKNGQDKGFPKFQPAFFVMKRDAYENSCKDFSARDGFDHMEFIGKEIWEKGKSKSLKDLGLEIQKDYYHIGGVTQSFIVGFGKTEEFKDEHYVYYEYVLKLPIPLNKVYLERVNKLMDLKKDFKNNNHWLIDFLKDI